MKYEGGKPQKIRRLPNMTNKTYMEVLPGALNMYRALVHIGAAGSSDSTILERGVYAYGTLHDNLPETLSFDYPLSLGITTSTNLQVGLVFPYGANLLIGWKNSTSYGVDVVSPSASPFATAKYEGLITHNSKIWAEKSANYLRGYFSSLVTGESIQLKYKIDRNSSWTEGSTSNTDNQNGYADTALDKEVRMPIPNMDNRYNEIQFGINFATNQSTSLSFYGIALELDDLSQEKRT